MSLYHNWLNGKVNGQDFPHNLGALLPSAMFCSFQFCQIPFQLARFKESRNPSSWKHNLVLIPSKKLVVDGNKWEKKGRWSSIFQTQLEGSGLTQSIKINCCSTSKKRKKLEIAGFEGERMKNQKETFREFFRKIIFMKIFLTTRNGKKLWRKMQVKTKNFYEKPRMNEP